VGSQKIRIGSVDLELFEEGTGAPLLFLHSGQGFDAAHPYVKPLAAQRRLIAPSHPGFGRSDLPDWVDSIDDIAHIYLDLMDRLGLAKVDVVGCSVGGWVAAELASKAPERISKLVMVGPVGVKIGPPDKLDIPDVFVIGPDAFTKLLFHDPDKFKMNPSAMSDEQLAIAMRNRESLALFVWEPYMHNPKLKHRLYRAKMPALFIRGASDGLVSQAYLEGYAKLLPNASTKTIEKAGHAPQIEQTEQFVSTVLSFLNG
jgi:pimeloyl-ACP methyl ester carboxylesterase